MENLFTPDQPARSPGLGQKVPDEIVTAEQTQESRGWLPDSGSVEVQKGGVLGW